LKRIIAILLITIVLFPASVLAEENTREVKLSQCVDSTSARFILDEQEIKIKFIGIEADEFIKTDSNDEINGQRVDDYVCSLLTNAKSIKIEYEPNISLLDKYGRTNAWVFVDGELLETHLVSLGYAKVAYLYDDYKYNDTLLEEEKKAKEGNLGIWSKSIEKQEEVVEEPKEETEPEGILDAIGNFFNKLFNKIGEFFNSIVEDILKWKKKTYIRFYTYYLF